MTAPAAGIIAQVPHGSLGQPAMAFPSPVVFWPLEETVCWGEEDRGKQEKPSSHKIHM